MKVLFMGTPDFSVPTLEELIKCGYEVVGVITQPDKPKGRGKTVTCLPTPVKLCASKYDIPIYQPKKIKDKDFIDTVLKKIEFDVIVVVAFGQILSKEILDMAKYGCINVHSSLLPKYRGAAPIQWTIINGEDETGVTTMYMDEGLDTGDILLQSSIKIEDDDTGESLHDKLADLGAKLLITTLEKIKQGDIKRIKQDESKASYVGMLNKKHGKIDFDKDAASIERLIRAVTPWPSAYTSLNGKMLKIWKARVLDDVDVSDDIKETFVNGQIVDITKQSIIVKTEKKYLECLEIQLEGKKRMAVEGFLRGTNIKKGTILGK